MIRKPVEHYMVKPNKTMGDWYYEYSNGSNINGCNCCKDTDKLSISIDSLRAALQMLLNSVQNMATGNIDPEQLASMIESAVSNHLQLSSSLTSLIDQRIDNKLGQITVEQLLTIIDNIEKIDDLKNINLLEIALYSTVIDGISDQVTEISNTLAGHINDNSVHVTAEEKAYWNTIAGGGTSPNVLINVQGTVLHMTTIS